MRTGHYARILGCMLGNAIGDAFGGAVEFKSAQRIRELTGGTWVDELYSANTHRGVNGAPRTGWIRKADPLSCSPPRTIVAETRGLCL